MYTVPMPGSLYSHNATTPSRIPRYDHTTAVDLLVMYQAVGRTPVNPRAGETMGPREEGAALFHSPRTTFANVVPRGWGGVRLRRLCARTHPKPLPCGRLAEPAPKQVTPLPCMGCARAPRSSGVPRHVLCVSGRHSPARPVWQDVCPNRGSRLVVDGRVVRRV